MLTTPNGRLALAELEVRLPLCPQVTYRRLTGSPRGSITGRPGCGLPWWPSGRSLRPCDRDGWGRGGEDEPQRWRERWRRGVKVEERGKTKTDGGGEDMRRPPASSVMRSWHEERRNGWSWDMWSGQWTQERWSQKVNCDWTNVYRNFNVGLVCFFKDDAGTGSRWDVALLLSFSKLAL